MTETALKTTPLHGLHRELGATLVAFAGYAMPVRYPAGILAEHRHTRERAGLFDVSHMGQIRLWPLAGASVDSVALALERLVPGDLLGLQPGRQRYTLFTDDEAGILDDLMVAHRGDHLLLVVNAACKGDDLQHLEAQLGRDCRIEPLPGQALLALQGPEAAVALERLAPGVEDMRFMDVRAVMIDGIECVVSRSGYTGEDGYELSIPAAHADPLARKLLAMDAVMPVGLGARDSLRLEAGLCLYGHDLDTTTTPVEAGLTWVIGRARRSGGARAGGYPGADRVQQQLAGGRERARVGLMADGKLPVREGAMLYAPGSDECVGRVSSGGFGPTVERPVAMAYVDSGHGDPGAALEADVRGRRVPMTVTGLPFTPHRYRS